MSVHRLRPVEQNTVQAGLPRRIASSRPPNPPPTVDHRAVLGQLQLGGDQELVHLRDAGHGAMEARGRGRILLQDGEVGRAEHRFEGRGAVPQRRHQLSGRAPGERPREVLQRWAYRQRRVRTQRLSTRRQLEAALAVLAQEVPAGQQAQHPVQRRRMRARGLGQLGGRTRAVGQVVGHTEPRHRAQRGGVREIDQVLEQGQRVSGVVGCLVIAEIHGLDCNGRLSRSHCYRLVMRSRCSGYRSPWTSICATASSILRRSSALSSRSAAPMFSSSRWSLRVPGIGTIQGLRASSQARAIWAGVAFPAAAMV